MRLICFVKARRNQLKERVSAWHALIFPLFGLPAPDWTEKELDQTELALPAPEETEDDAAGSDGEEDEDEVDEDEEEE